MREILTFFFIRKKINVNNRRIKIPGGIRKTPSVFEMRNITLESSPFPNP